LKNIDCVILDWAGTTIDYGCFAPLEAFIQAFREKNIEITVEEAREPMGMLKRDHIQAILDMPGIQKLWNDEYGENYTKKDIEDLYNKFETKIFEVLKDFTTPIDGVVEIIKYLKSKNIKIGSTTGYTSEMMRVVTREAKTKGYQPDNWVSSDIVKKGRPYPFMIYKNLLDLGVANTNNVIKIGDTTVDIKEGRNAKVWSVGVILGSSELGFSKKEVENLSELELKNEMKRVRKKMYKAGAHFVIDSIKDIPDLLEIIEAKLEIGEKPC